MPRDEFAVATVAAADPQFIPTVEASQKWFKITETPDGRTMLQLGKQVPGTEHILVPVQTGYTRNSGKVHSLAYEVDSADTSAVKWADIEKAWLETGLQIPSVIFKLVATPSGEIALLLGKFKEHSDESEFIIVSTEFQRNLKESLLELPTCWGDLTRPENMPTTVNEWTTNSRQ